MKRALLGLFTAITFTGFGQVPTNGNLVHIPFDKKTEDVSVHGLRVEDSTNISYTDDRFGQPNMAGLFNGTDALVRMVDSSYLDFSSTQEFSVGVWFKAEYPQNPASNDISAIFSFDGDCYDMTFSFQFRADSTLLFGTHANASSGNNGCWNNIEEQCNTNKWHHAVATVSSSKIDFYLDGVIKVSRAVNSSSFAFHPSNFMIGAWRSRDSPQTLHYFKGAIDDAIVYDRLLSDKEIESIYLSSTTAQSEINELIFNAYPNPLSDILTIETKEASNIQIIDIQGKLLFNEKSNGILRVNTQNWNPGTYLIKVSNGFNYTVKKVIK